MKQKWLPMNIETKKSGGRRVDGRMSAPPGGHSPHYRREQDLHRDPNRSPGSFAPILTLSAFGVGRRRRMYLIVSVLFTATDTPFPLAVVRVQQTIARIRPFFLVTSLHLLVRLPSFELNPSAFGGGPISGALYCNWPAFHLPVFG